MTDLPSFRAEPDVDFADRLERELMLRLTAPAAASPTEVPLMTDVPDTDDLTARDDEAADRRRVRRFRLVAGGIAAGLVVVLAVVAAISPEHGPATAPPVANGLIAFVGGPRLDPSTSDIYAVAPDGTGLRQLTSTPELAEYAPAWSPDGSRLAFVRTDVYYRSSFPCVARCQLVVMDPSTGVETFAADIPQPDGEGGWVPRSLRWSPDGRAITIRLIGCGIGGCGGELRPVIVDLDTEAVTERRTLIEDGSDPVISPDGSRIAYVHDRQQPFGDMEIWVAGADGSHRRLVTPSMTLPVWSPDGTLLLASDGDGWFTIRPDGTDRTALRIKDHTPPVFSPDIIEGRVDWQPVAP